ncbi:MAG: hypothetical protein ACJAXJ_004076 [Colwellia sp.]|jgi:hypothetical protein
MEIAKNVFGLLVIFYIFMTALDIWSIIIPERQVNGALFKDLPEYSKVHLWYAIYPVKTPGGWKCFRYVKRKQETNGNTCSETSDSWWVYC